MQAIHKAKPRRNGLISKIHVAKKSLALSEESYRDVLFGATGKESCSDMNDTELEQALKAFERFGFKPQPKQKSNVKKRPANSAQAKKIRALWLNLHHLGELADSSEDALEVFVKRTCKVDSLEWLQANQANDVIRALRGWLSRVGYHHPDAGDHKIFGTEGLAENICLVHRQCEILGIKDIYQWIYTQGLGDYCTLSQIDREDLLQIIKILGNKIRQKKVHDV